MKLWIDDCRPAPDGYIWAKSVSNARMIIEESERSVKYHTHQISPHRLNGNLKHILKIQQYTIELIDIDHDAGEFAKYGGDYIKLLDWLEATGRNYPIRIHSMNPIGVENMRRIIQRNGWKEIMGD